MGIRDALLAGLTSRFGDRMRTFAPPGPIAVFPAQHADVGSVTIRDTGIETNFIVSVEVGAIVADCFHNFDHHLDPGERRARLTRDVVRFLQELFADRLLMWRSTDGRNAGWRERGDAGHTEPLVLDNRVYRIYLWSGPLPAWQAIPTILGRGRIRDDRDYQILAGALEDPASTDLDAPTLEAVKRLAAEYSPEDAT
jgi:hypothetical protein